MSDRLSEPDTSTVVHLLYIRAAVDGVNKRLDDLNGRTRENEEDIAVLKDRSADAKKSGGIAGTIGGFLGGVLSGMASQWLGKP